MGIVLSNNPSNSYPALRGQVGRSLRAEGDEGNGCQEAAVCALGLAFHELTLLSDLAHKRSHLSGEDKTTELQT